MESTDSAATRVFDTAELLELIFLQVPHKDLAKLQLVSKYARDLISSSTKMQWKLCLLPLEAVTIDTTGKPEVDTSLDRVGINHNRALRLGETDHYYRMEYYKFGGSPFRVARGTLHVSKTDMGARSVLSLNPDSEMLNTLCNPDRDGASIFEFLIHRTEGSDPDLVKAYFRRGMRIADVLAYAKEVIDGGEPSMEGAVKIRTYGSQSTRHSYV